MSRSFGSAGADRGRGLRDPRSTDGLVDLDEEAFDGVVAIRIAACNTPASVSVPNSPPTA